MSWAGGARGVAKSCAVGCATATGVTLKLGDLILTEVTLCTIVTLGEVRGALEAIGAAFQLVANADEGFTLCLTVSDNVGRTCGPGTAAKNPGVVAGTDAPSEAVRLSPSACFTCPMTLIRTWAGKSAATSCALLPNLCSALQTVQSPTHPRYIASNSAFAHK